MGLVALNSDPVTDNPFVLQLALVVSSKEIWVCEKFEDSFDTKYQIPINSNVLALYYTRYCEFYKSGDALRRPSRNHSAYPYAL